MIYEYISAYANIIDLFRYYVNETLVTLTYN